MLCAAGVLVSLAVILAGGFYLRLLAGPIELQDHSARVSGALASRMGSGWAVTLGDTALEMHGIRPAVRMTGVEIRNPDGLPVLRAPYGIVSLDVWSLLTGAVSAREVELRDLQLRASLAPDGTLTFMSGEDAGPAPSPSPPASNPDGAGTRSPVAAAVASLLGPVVETSGVIGGLDRATIKSARLTLVGSDGRERAAFPRVDAEFVRLPNGDRRVDVDLTGSHGSWAIRGRVTEGEDRKADLEALRVPVADILLLAGLPEGAVRSDLLLSGQVSTTLRGPHLLSLDARFESSAGTLLRNKGTPLRIDRLSAAATWDEARRELEIASLDGAGEGMSIRLAGRLGPAPETGWRLALSGRNAEVAGIKPTDATFAIDDLAADVLFRNGSVSLERFALKAPQIDIQASGALQSGPDGHRMQGVLEASQTELRRLVRLWPDNLNPELRRYLALRVVEGSVDRLRLRSNLDPRDFSNVFTDVPLTDAALDLDFMAGGIGLAVVDGIPPLRGLSVEGRASGARVSLKASAGRIAMPDGRSLAFSDGTYLHTNMDVPNSAAQLAFAVAGSADAVASLLASPAIRDAVGLDLDPATVKGRADIRVRLSLVPKRIPNLSEMPLNIRATLSDISVEKLLGREKLEAGQFNLAYEAGALTGRGEARLGGAPTTFEFSQPRTGPGEVAIGLILDEAARTRRSLPGAPQLTGPVPVRITVPLAGGMRGGARIEADFGKAAIDGLIPGWVKPANRPGRLAFTYAEGEGGASELRDLSVDAGSVQIKGQLSLSPSGGVEKADLSTFKLSPGDDMRAQVEHLATGPYRVTLRGNVADTRPVLKWAGSTAGKGPAKESHEVELELGLNILTGHNDEAMTGVSGKASIKGGELRALQFGGRFRTAAVEAQLAKRDAGAPILAVRSADAGATLRFLDIYRRMIGGKLAIDGRSGDGIQSGNLVIDDFGLRDEPALRNIASQAGQQSSGGSEDRGFAQAGKADLEQVPFTKLSADFRRSASRFDFSDVVIYGVQVGFNVSGFVDYARDRLDVTGTFVPAYMLNNAFSQLPLVGILLGGGINEGLIAVEFRVAGPISGPVLTVNPLTAVAPGILRKLFGWMLPEGAEPTTAAPRVTGTAPPRRTTR
ncbi:DUF3971 domain-containing protein [uncultured Enterovirga sp.]|uniref:YhdP family protein n=1 Tax=uncultured Enterovirga sp. TaxID=2026352 RepID=UPI0035C9EA00